LGYPIPEKSQENSKKAVPHAPQEKSSKERGNGLTGKANNKAAEKPSVRLRLTTLQTASKGMKKERLKEHIR